jgi:predicted DNA-binding transcriptional regulator AlpA
MDVDNEPYLTVAQFCARWAISTSTFYKWQASGAGPVCFRLPNGSLRIPSSSAQEWAQARIQDTSG